MEPTIPDDARNGDYTRERLIRMDEKFCERMQRAIQRGLERPQESALPEARSAVA